MVLLLLQGFVSLSERQFLSDAVMMTVLGTTTATIVSIVVIVAAYLFPKNRG